MLYKMVETEGKLISLKPTYMTTHYPGLVHVALNKSVLVKLAN
jgi:hypothetical protein